MYELYPAEFHIAELARQRAEREARQRLMATGETDAIPPRTLPVPFLSWLSARGPRAA